jgi:hypothetical protein
LAAIFNRDIAAIWLYSGSLFSPVALDIDLHVLLRRTPDPSENERIRGLHSSVSKGIPWVDEIDAWYILLADAARADEPSSVGPWHAGLKDRHWSLHRAHWLAGACIVMHGLSPSDVVKRPQWKELEATLRIETQAEAQAGGEEGNAASPYWTLQLCRVLASLETHTIVWSKLDSGDWAREHLPGSTHAIIDAATRYYTRNNNESDEALIAADYPAFYRLIRPMIDGTRR